MKTNLFSLKLFLLVFFASFSVKGWGQTTIFSENMGTPTGNTAITANSFQNPLPITFSGTADVRSKTVSNYSGASGGGNIFFAAAGGRNFIISNINTNTYSNIKLDFGYLSTTAAMGVLIETSVDNGSTWVTLGTYKNSNTSWALQAGILGVPSAANLSIRFSVGTTGGGARLDDVKLTGTVSCTPPTPTWVNTIPATGCIGQTQRYETQSGMTNYVWTLPVDASTYQVIAGGTSTDNYVEVKYLKKGGKNVSVKYTNAAGCGSTVTSNTQITNGVSISPVAVQDIVAGTNGNQLNISEDGTSTFKEWKYTTTSGSGYVSFSPAQTGTSYTPNFSTAGTYYVVNEATYSCGTMQSNEVQVNVTALQKPVITSSATQTTTYGLTGGASTYTITASNTPTSYAITSPSPLPAGFTYDAPSRQLTIGDTAPAGDYVFTLTATNAAGTSDPFTLTWKQNKKGVTISNVKVVTKVYDGNLEATLDVSTATINTLAGGDAGLVTVSNAGTKATFNNKNVATNKPVTITAGFGLSLIGAKADNYYISSQPTSTALRGEITPKDITVMGIIANDKPYDGNTTATFNTSAAVPNGIIGSDVVNVFTVVGNFDNPNVGTNKSITLTPPITLGGTDAINYTVNPLPTFTAAIYKADPKITPNSISVTVDGTQQIVSSNTEVPMTFSSADPSVATIDGAGLVKGIAIGATSIIVNQAATANYNAVVDAAITVNVTKIVYNIGDFRSTSDGTWHSTTANGTATWEVYEGVNAQGNDVWSTTGNPKPSYNATILGSKTVYIQNAITLVGNNTAPAVVVLDKGELSTNTVIATFGNLLVKSGGIFNREANSSGIKSGGIFEVEDGGTVTFKHTNSNSRSTSIWAGEERFHPNSNFIIKTTDSTSDFLVVQTTSDVSPYNGACFGNIILEHGTGGSINLLPNGFSGTLTAGNLIVKNLNGDLRFSNNPYNATINGNLIIENTITARKVNLYAGSSGVSTLTINGNIIHKGSDNINLNTGASGGTLNLYLKGNLEVASTGKLLATNANTSTFNFIGNGTIQTIDVANQATASNLTFNVNSGTSVKLINQDLSLGTNSSFNVKSGGTLDFGFADTKALNILGNSSGQKFTSEAGSTLKITSPYGITNVAASADAGNVQVPVNSRTFSNTGIYHYIGKENQTTGNALPSGTNVTDGGVGIKVIADLETSNASLNDNLTLNINGIKYLSTDGELEIRRGTVLDASSNGFNDAASERGKLTMSGGRYKITRTASSTQPAMGGAYNLTGGVIEFAGTSAMNVRASNKEYYNVEVSGSNVTAGTTDNTGITIKPNGSFRVTDTGVFRVPNPQGFSGAAGSAIRSTNNPVIILDPLSTIDYSGTANQVITKAPTNIANVHYQNLKISGSGIKTATGTTTVNSKVLLKSGTLQVLESADSDPSNILYANKGIQKTDDWTDGIAVFENNAILMQDVDATNTAEVKVLRKATVESKQYNLWSSPVVAQDLYQLYGAAGLVPANTVMEYITKTDTFKPVVSGTTSINAKGYSAKGLADNANTDNEVIANFKGIPNNNNIEIPLSVEGNRFNLVGNPYPSNLNLNQLYAENNTNPSGIRNMTPTVRFWDNTNNNVFNQLGNQYQGQNYALYNLEAEIGVPATNAGTPAPNGDTAKVPDGIVKPGQGFIIKANTSGDQKLYFNNTQRISTSNVDTPYYKGSVAKNRFWLSLSTPDSVVNTIAIAYNEKASNLNDSYDSALSNTSASDMLYSLSDDQAKLAIQSRQRFEETDVVKLGTKYYKQGQYKLSVYKKDGIFDDSQKIYIHDKVLNIYHDLSEEAYSFNSDAVFTDARFEVVYKAESVLGNTELAKSSFVVYKDGDYVVVKSNKTLGEVEVYDVTGRLVHHVTTKDNEVRISVLLFNQGVYIVKAENAGNSQVKKFIK